MGTSSQSIRERTCQYIGIKMKDIVTHATACDCRRTMVSLCREFHGLGWMTGTGGAISMKQHEEIFITPSGVLKEQVTSDDIFKVNMDGEIIKAPDKPGLKFSSCFPNFCHIYRLRPKTRTIFHTHSMAAVLVSLMEPGNCKDKALANGERNEGPWMGRYSYH